MSFTNMVFNEVRPFAETDRIRLTFSKKEQYKDPALGTWKKIVAMCEGTRSQLFTKQRKLRSTTINFLGKDIEQADILEIKLLNHKDNIEDGWFERQ